jgi:hypothetical protein
VNADIRAANLDWDEILAAVAKDGECHLCDELTEVPDAEMDATEREAIRRGLTVINDYDGIWVVQTP